MTAYDAPLRHSFDAYFGRIVGSRAFSFARTMSRRRAPERHDGHWGLAAGAWAGAIRAGFSRERDRPARPAGADGRRSERTWRRRDRASPAPAEIIEVHSRTNLRSAARFALVIASLLLKIEPIVKSG